MDIQYPNLSKGVGLRWTWHVASSQLHKLLEAQLTPLLMERMMEKTEQAEGWDPSLP